MGTVLERRRDRLSFKKVENKKVVNIKIKSAGNCSNTLSDPVCKYPVFPSQ